MEIFSGLNIHKEKADILNRLSYTKIPQKQKKRKIFFMRIRKQNDIFAYFETIGMLEPKSILDAGMFLKRVGSVSRQIMNREVPKEIRLEGIDFFPEISFASWDNIYDDVCIWQKFFEESEGRHYELGIVLGFGRWKEGPDTEEFFQRVRDCCDYLLLDRLAGKEIKSIEDSKIKYFNLEGDVYYFIDNRR